MLHHALRINGKVKPIEIKERWDLRPTALFNFIHRQSLPIYYGKTQNLKNL